MKKASLALSASLILYLGLMLVACGFSIHSDSDKKSNKVEGDKWPTPSSYASGIPVYNTFEELESLFHFNNDTTYVINFWATWCKPCVKELPYLEAFHAKSEGTKTKVILISLDFPKHIESKLVPFVKERQLAPDVLVLLDGKFNKWIDKVSTEWDGTIPATYVYQDTRTLFISEAFESIADLEEAVSQL